MPNTLLDRNGKNSFTLESNATYRFVAVVWGSPSLSDLTLGAERAGWGSFRIHHFFSPSDEGPMQQLPNDWPLQAESAWRLMRHSEDVLARGEGVFLGPARDVVMWPLEHGGQMHLLQVWRYEPPPVSVPIPAPAPPFTPPFTPPAANAPSPAQNDSGPGIALAVAGAALFAFILLGRRR